MLNLIQTILKLLSLCYSISLSHDYMPPDMIKTSIVPIVKNK